MKNELTKLQVHIIRTECQRLNLCSDYRKSLLHFEHHFENDKVGCFEQNIELALYLIHNLHK